MEGPADSKTHAVNCYVTVAFDIRPAFPTLSRGIQESERMITSITGEGGTFCGQIHLGKTVHSGPT